MLSTVFRRLTSTAKNLASASISTMVKDGSLVTIPLRRAKASSGLTSNVHGGLYESSCLMFDVPMQLLGFPDFAILGHP